MLPAVSAGGAGAVVNLAGSWGDAEEKRLMERRRGDDVIRVYDPRSGRLLADSAF
ncbi:hypothetical protein MUK42_23540 [Musa troglodytarum]|uniref:Uncharacterized protein n=1 Tax=Musa troglodytarum TaxID=320322 RepID=A0A9E7L9H8_9LILI|nr:hypothetical protein MUK42_23540 [Musa troglodytarum]